MKEISTRARECKLRKTPQMGSIDCYERTANNVATASPCATRIRIRKVRLARLAAKRWAVAGAAEPHNKGLQPQHSSCQSDWQRGAKLVLSSLR